MATRSASNESTMGNAAPTKRNQFLINIKLLWPSVQPNLTERLRLRLRDGYQRTSVYSDAHVVMRDAGSAVGGTRAPTQCRFSILTSTNPSSSGPMADAAAFAAPLGCRRMPSERGHLAASASPVVRPPHVHAHLA